jgi:glycosyltransferase involved in cell wall biosynthesis
MGYLKGADAVAAYHVADAFAFASTTETQGLVIGEAMAAGLPVIAVEDHAVEDFVINGRTGLVVPGRAEDLGVAIDGLLADDAQLLSYSEAGLRRAACFSIEHQAERLEMHYTHAIESHRPRRRFARLALPRARRKDA